MANKCALWLSCRNSTLYLSSVSSVFWAIFFILAFIGYESFYKGKNSEQTPLSRYKQSHLKRKVRGRYDGNERERSWQDERDSKGLLELSQYAEELMYLSLRLINRIWRMPCWIKVDYCLLKKCLQTPERRQKKEKVILKNGTTW